MNQLSAPTIGLALSGASARSVYYIGFLEVLKENQVHINYISATSGSCIVAAAFACNTLPELKELAFSMNREFLFTIIERSKDKGGIYRMDKVEQELLKYTKGLKFEDVKPHMGFICTNINTGEKVVLSIGDIAKAICASCAVPGLFKPIRWGNWDLVDGGLVSIVPGPEAREVGSDIVIGIHLSPRDHVFNNLEMGLKKVIDFFSSIFSFNRAKQAFNRLAIVLEKNKYFSYFLELDDSELELPVPGMFGVLGKAIDIAIEVEKKGDPRADNFGCDLLIEPDLPFVSTWKRLSYMHFSDMSESRQFYEYGRKAAESYLPKINELINQKQHGSQR